MIALIFSSDDIIQLYLDGFVHSTIHDFNVMQGIYISFHKALHFHITSSIMLTGSL